MLDEERVEIEDGEDGKTLTEIIQEVLLGIDHSGVMDVAEHAAASADAYTHLLSFATTTATGLALSVGVVVVLNIYRRMK